MEPATEAHRILEGARHACAPRTPARFVVFTPTLFRRETAVFGPNDYRLGGGSSAIDAADNFAVPGDIETDLDDNPRFVDDPNTKDTGNGKAPIVDMGAYEFQVVAACDWDLDGDGNVGTSDLIQLLGNWGPCR